MRRFGKYDLYLLLAASFLGCLAMVVLGYNRSWNMISFTASYGIFLAWFFVRSRRD